MGTVSRHWRTKLFASVGTDGAALCNTGGVTAGRLGVGAAIVILLLFLDEEDLSSLDRMLDASHFSVILRIRLSTCVLLLSDAATSHSAEEISLKPSRVGCFL